MKKKRNSSTSQRKRKETGAAKRTGRQKIGRFFLHAAAFFNALVAAAMVVSAYGSFFEPEDSRPLAVFAFAFPICFFIELIAVIAWAACRKWKQAVIFFLPFLLTAKASYVFFPLNILPDFSSDKDKENSFTMMTYNTFYFYDSMDRNLDYCGTVSEIMKQNCDVVAMQEMYNFEPQYAQRFTKAQSDSLKAMYPYRSSGHSMGLLSKYPIKSTNVITSVSDDYQMVRYELEIKGKTVALYNVHLQSIGLTNEDKEFYEKTTSKEIIHEGKQVRSTLSTIKNRLYRKLADAMVARAHQAKVLRKHLDKEKGNVILCGDFNDISTSYAYRKIKGDMTDAYAKCAFGPTITYHKNRFYFKIDYVMYSGNLKAVKEKRPGRKWSDHYPLVTEFVLNNN